MSKLVYSCLNLFFHVFSQRFIRLNNLARLFSSSPTLDINFHFFEMNFLASPSISKVFLQESNSILQKVSFKPHLRFLTVTAFVFWQRCELLIALLPQFFEELLQLWSRAQKMANIDKVKAQNYLNIHLSAGFSSPPVLRSRQRTQAKAQCLKVNQNGLNM